MICITVSRKDLKKICGGVESKIIVKKVSENTDNGKGIAQVVDEIIKRQHLSERIINDNN